LTSLPTHLVAAFVFAGFLLPGTPGDAHGQGRMPGVPEGSRVRVTRCPSGAEVCGPRLDGRLVGQDPVGLALRLSDSTARIPWAAVDRIEVYRGAHGALRTVGFAVGGLVLGSVLGIAAGALLQGDCYELECLEGPAYGFLVGAPVGLGAGITLALTTRERWTTAYRAAGVVIGPERVATEPRVRVGLRIPLGR
jgi:hypothetical protein